MKNQLTKREEVYFYCFWVSGRIVCHREMHSPVGSVWQSRAAPHMLKTQFADRVMCCRVLLTSTASYPVT